MRLPTLSRMAESFCSLSRKSRVLSATWRRNSSATKSADRNRPTTPPSPHQNAEGIRGRLRQPAAENMVIDRIRIGQPCCQQPIDCGQHLWMTPYISYIKQPSGLILDRGVEQMIALGMDVAELPVGDECFGLLAFRPVKLLLQRGVGDDCDV